MSGPARRSRRASFLSRLMTTHDMLRPAGRASESALRPSRGAVAAAALLPMLLAGCSSVDRTPATAAAPAESLVEPEAPETTEPAPEPVASAAGGLTDAEIRALPPEDEVGVDVIGLGGVTLDELNASGVLRDIQFGYDSANLSEEARGILQENAAWLSRYPDVRVLIEGHCDERGTVEYNLALGEERARSTRDYLRGLGIEESRMRIISYGKEFPLDIRSNEEAWRRNRRAHLEIIAK